MEAQSRRACTLLWFVRKCRVSLEFEPRISRIPDATEVNALWGLGSGGLNIKFQADVMAGSSS